MTKLWAFAFIGFFIGAFPNAARADFLVTSAIIEFTADGPRQQDIEIVSRSKDNDYIQADVSEIVHPGAPDESRRLITDPDGSALLDTPTKTVLSGGGRKVMRFVLLKNPDEKEHIYRVAIKPVIKGVNNNAKVGLKILVGYEVLVIIRPVTPHVAYEAQRQGQTFTVTNTGNTNILFQSGQQCKASNDCALAPVVRVYPGQTAQVTLPSPSSVSYSVWDGTEATEKSY